MTSEAYLDYMELSNERDSLREDVDRLAADLADAQNECIALRALNAELIAALETLSCWPTVHSTLDPVDSIHEARNYARAAVRARLGEG